MGVTGGPVVYVGRHRPEWLESLDAAVLTDWDVLPRSLSRAVDSASELILFDPASFPYEQLDETGRDLPLTVVLPDALSGEDSRLLFGQPVLESLTVFDRVAGTAEQFDRFAADRFGWHQWIDTDRRSAPDVVGDAIAGARENRLLFEQLVVHGDTDLVWPVPTTSAKARHRVLRRHVSSGIARARRTRPETSDYVGILVGGGFARWVPEMLAHCNRVVAVEPNRAMWIRGSSSFPQVDFRQLGPQMRLAVERERFELVVVDIGLNGRSPDQRREVLEGAYSALRPGGSLMVIEKLVSPTAEYGARDLERDVAAAAHHALVLDDARAVQLPGETHHTHVVLQASKLGTPERL